MKRIVPLLAFAAVAVAATSSAMSGGGSVSHDGVTFDVDAVPGAQATLVSCLGALDVMSMHGWRVTGAHVRIQADPFDATAPAADFVLGTATTADDSAFDLTAGLVTRQLRQEGAAAATAESLGATVAAHLSAPGCSRRVAWEQEWRAGVTGGDLLATALPELLWRTGQDAAIREAARGGWPGTAYAVLAARGVVDPLRGMGEVALAGLINPDGLGFHALADATTLPVPEASLDATFSSTGLRLLALPVDGTAVALQEAESEHAAAWVVVKYALTGSFDAVPLNPVGELTVPLRGVAWGAVVAVGDGPDGRLSLGARPVADYPVRVGRWDFLASNDSATLSWETQRQNGLQGFVVEALQAGRDGGWRVLRRTLVPVASDGESQFGYEFVDDDTTAVGGYRLLAVTADGLLAEIGMFPLRDQP